MTKIHIDYCWCDGVDSTHTYTHTHMKVDREFKEGWKKNQTAFHIYTICAEGLNKPSSALFVQLLSVLTLRWTLLYAFSFSYILNQLFPPMLLADVSVCAWYYFLCSFFFLDMLVSKWIPWKYLFRWFIRFVRLVVPNVRSFVLLNWMHRTKHQTCQRRERPTRPRVETQHDTERL